MPNSVAPQGDPGSQPVPEAAPEPPSGTGGGWLWDPLLMYDTSGYRARGSSVRVSWAAAPVGPICTGGNGSWHLPLYISFLEILPQELATSEQRILKVILLLAGFALLTGLLFIQI